MPTSAHAILRMARKPVPNNAALAWALVHAMTNSTMRFAMDKRTGWPAPLREEVALDHNVTNALLVDVSPAVTDRTYQSMLLAMGDNLMPMTTTQAKHMFKGNAMNKLRRLMGAALHAAAPGIDNRMVVTLDNRNRLGAWAATTAAVTAYQHGERLRSFMKPRQEEMLVFERNYHRLFLQHLQQLRRSLRFT